MLRDPSIQILLHPLVGAVNLWITAFWRVFHHLIARGLRNAPCGLEPLDGEFRGLVGVDAIGPQRGIGGLVVGHHLAALDAVERCGRGRTGQPADAVPAGAELVGHVGWRQALGFLLRRILGDLARLHRGGIVGRVQPLRQFHGVERALQPLPRLQLGDRRVAEIAFGLGRVVAPQLVDHRHRRGHLHRVLARHHAGQGVGKPLLADQLVDLLGPQHGRDLGQHVGAGGPLKRGLQLRQFVLAEHRRRRGVVHRGDTLGGSHALAQRAGDGARLAGSIGATGAIQPRVAASW
jgi:hypothetical protein